MRSLRRPGQQLGLAVGATVLLAAYAWWVVALPEFSGRATGVVVATGVVAMVVGMRREPRFGGATPSAPGTGRWVVLLVALAVWQVAAYLEQPREDHPTLSSMTNALLDTHLARAAAFVVWVLVAVELARR